MATDRERFRHFTTAHVRCQCREYLVSVSDHHATASCLPMDIFADVDNQFLSEMRDVAQDEARRQWKLAGMAASVLRSRRP